MLTDDTLTETPPLNRISLIVYAPFLEHLVPIWIVDVTLFQELLMLLIEVDCQFQSLDAANDAEQDENFSTLDRYWIAENDVVVHRPC